MEGKYIYGIIGTDSETVLDISGLGGSRPVYTVAHQDLGCIVSDYSGAELSSMSKEEVVRCLLSHQTVVEYVMRKHTVLSVKFGTVLATSHEVRDLLVLGRQQFDDTLAWIQDKIEVEVAATWDTGEVLREISNEADVVRARAAIASRPGQQTLEDRVHLGQMVKAAMDRRRQGYGERIASFLEPVAVDVQPNALVSDAMVVNMAFLVEKAGQQEFDCRVRQLNDVFHDQIDFRIIGPLPPYSFATVEVTRLSPEKIEEARQLLQLGDTMSEPEVRKAYRRLAAETHPDRKRGSEMAKSQFVRLRQAADLLIDCCRGHAELGGGFSITIKRSKVDEAQHLCAAETGSVAGVARV